MADRICDALTDVVVTEQPPAAPPRITYEGMLTAPMESIMRRYRVLADGEPIGVVEGRRRTRSKTGTWSNRGDVTELVWRATSTAGTAGPECGTRVRAVHRMLDRG